jgi:hypothetical protein
MNDVRREKYQVMPALPAEDYARRLSARRHWMTGWRRQNRRCVSCVGQAKKMTHYEWLKTTFVDSTRFQ